MWWIKERINGLRSKRCSLPQTQPAEVILPVPFKILNSSVPTVHEVTLSTCTDTTPVPSPARAPMQVTGPTARPGRPPHLASRPRQLSPAPGPPLSPRPARRVPRSGGWLVAGPVSTAGAAGLRRRQGARLSAAAGPMPGPPWSSGPKHFTIMIENCWTVKNHCTKEAEKPRSAGERVGGRASRSLLARAWLFLSPRRTHGHRPANIPLALRWGFESLKATSFL